jgi:hypothetical protein
MHRLLLFGSALVLSLPPVAEAREDMEPLGPVTILNCHDAQAMERGPRSLRLIRVAKDAYHVALTLNGSASPETPVGPVVGLHPNGRCVLALEAALSSGGRALVYFDPIVGRIYEAEAYDRSDYDRPWTCENTELGLRRRVSACRQIWTPPPAPVPAPETDEAPAVQAPPAGRAAPNQSRAANARPGANSQARPAAPTPVRP